MASAQCSTLDEALRRRAKSLSENTGALVSNPGAGEVKKREVVCGFLFPAGEDAAEAIHPAVGALDDPAAGFVAGFAFDFFRLFAARFDVGREAELLA